MKKVGLPSRYMRLGVHALAALGLCVGVCGPLQAQQIQPRSLADVRDRPNEIPPRYLWADREMASRPQIRRGPFVALTATPMMSLDRLATQVEEANAAYVRMSSLWNDRAVVEMERIDPIAVLAHDVADLRDAPPPGVYVDFDGTLHLVLPANGHESPQLAHELRTGLVRHVLISTCQTANLSKATTEDLASFIATYGAPTVETECDLFGTTGEPLVARGPRGEIEDAIAFRYLWQGNDAALAPRFAVAMRAAIEGRDAQQLERLLAEASSQATREHWLANPLAGQPRIEDEEGVSAELAVRQREMALILKLASRFPAERTSQVTPRITSFEDGELEATSSNPSRPQRSFDAFCNQVMYTTDWATLDVDGEVLFGSDQQRLAELFAQSEGRYQFVNRDGQEVLVGNWHEGEVISAVLTRDEENPTRPLAIFSQEAAE